MAGDVANVDGDDAIAVQDIVVVTADFVRRFHKRCNVEAVNGGEFVRRGEDHVLHLAHEVEFGTHAEVVGGEALVEGADLSMRLRELGRALLDALLQGGIRLLQPAGHVVELIGERL